MCCCPKHMNRIKQLITKCCNITEVRKLKHNFLFEIFNLVFSNFASYYVFCAKVGMNILNFLITSLHSTLHASFYDAASSMWYSFWIQKCLAVNVSLSFSKEQVHYIDYILLYTIYCDICKPYFCLVLEFISVNIQQIIIAFNICVMT